MTKMEYANKVAELVNGEVRMVEKANGVVLTGITSKDGDVRPTVYIEDMYEKYDIEMAADNIKQIYETNYIPQLQHMPKYYTLYQNI